MRIAVVIAVCALAACAGEKLASTPLRGVDLSGHWKLNVADSDDPTRLMQSQLAAATATAATPSGSSGRGGRQGGGMPAGGPLGPIMPPVLLLDEALRWPGKDLTLTQGGGTVSFASDGTVRSCRPNQGKEHHSPPPSASDPSRGRDAPSHGRGDVPPPRCGWDEVTLVVQSGEPDDEHPPFEQRFSLSEDGQRLVELVIFKSGRSSGFVASREWDRAPAGAAPGLQQ
jgi:hypothetical protein